MSIHTSTTDCADVTPAIHPCSKRSLRWPVSGGLLVAASLLIHWTGTVHAGSVTAGSADHSSDAALAVPEVNTFSIVAYDPDTGDLGVAVASKVLGVGSIVPWAKAGVGAVATQSYANTSYGPRGLELMAAGESAAEVVTELTEADEGRALRQLGLVDASGRAAAHTGDKCMAWAGHRTGEHFTIQGNLLAGEEVVRAMERAYLAARDSGEGRLPDWLLAALSAGDNAGGDARGKQSASLLVVREGAGYGGNDRFVDLRVEDHAEPVTELGRLLEVHKTFFAASHRNVPRR